MDTDLDGFIAPDDDMGDGTGIRSSSSSSVPSGGDRKRRGTKRRSTANRRGSRKRKHWCVPESSNDEAGVEEGKPGGTSICSTGCEGSGDEPGSDVAGGTGEVKDDAQFWFSRARLLQKMALEAMQLGQARMRRARQPRVNRGRWESDRICPHRAR